MNSPALTGTLDELGRIGHIELDWNDVLQRAARRRRRTMRRLTLATVALLAIAPGLSVAAVKLTTEHRGPSATAVIDDDAQAVHARLSLRPVGELRHVGGGSIGWTQDAVFSLHVESRSPVAARIRFVRGGGQITLCKTCATETTGRAGVPRGGWLRIADGRAVLEIDLGPRTVRAPLRRDK
jgi:hypothetical protein